MTHLTLRSRTAGEDHVLMTETQQSGGPRDAQGSGDQGGPVPLRRTLFERGPIVETTYGDHLLTRHADCFNVLREARFSSNDSHKPGFPQISELSASSDTGSARSADADHAVRRPARPHAPASPRQQGLHPKAIEAMRPRIAVASSTASSSDAEHAARWSSSRTSRSAAGHGHQRDARRPDRGPRAAAGLDGRRSRRPSTRTTTSPTCSRGRGDPGDAHVLRRAGRRRRRKDLGDDLLQRPHRGRRRRRPPTHDELLDTTILLFGAGHETTVNLISGGTLNLLRHPDQLQRLRDDPSLIATAVEELLRFGPPCSYGADHDDRRRARRQAAFRRAAADRDARRQRTVIPRCSTIPTTSTSARTENRHLSFGGGIHLCLGAPLARVEGQEAIGRLVRRFPGATARRRPGRVEADHHHPRPGPSPAHLEQDVARP